MPRTCTLCSRLLLKAWVLLQINVVIEHETTAGYRIARNIGGVKLWRISKILHWRKKLWRIANLEDQAEI